MRYHHHRVDTGHLLVGVMLTEGSIGFQVLELLNVTALYAEPFLPTLAPAEADAPEYPINSPSLDTALDLAEDEAARLGSHYVGTEHFLLGITRTNVGNATDLLRGIGSTPDHVRRRTLLIIKEGATEFSLEAARRHARLSELSRRVLFAAEQMAVDLDHPDVGIGHLLMVLLRERRSYTSKLLHDSGLSEKRLHKELKNRGAALLVNIEDVLENALAQAERLGSHYTGTDHMLLALCVHPAGIAILTSHNLKPTTIIEKLENQMRPGTNKDV